MGCKGGDGERGEVRAGRRASGNRFKGGMNVTLSDYRVTSPMVDAGHFIICNVSF